MPKKVRALKLDNTFFESDMYKTLMLHSLKSETFKGIEILFSLLYHALYNEKTIETAEGEDLFKYLSSTLLKAEEDVKTVIETGILCHWFSPLSNNSIYCNILDSISSERTENAIRMEKMRRRKKDAMCITENVTNVTQNVTNVTESVTNVTQNVTNVTESVTNVTQNVTNVTKWGKNNKTLFNRGGFVLSPLSSSSASSPKERKEAKERINTPSSSSSPLTPVFTLVKTAKNGNFDPCVPSDEKEIFKGGERCSENKERVSCCEEFSEIKEDEKNQNKAFTPFSEKKKDSYNTCLCSEKEESSLNLSSLFAEGNSDPQSSLTEPSSSGPESVCSSYKEYALSAVKRVSEEKNRLARECIIPSARAITNPVDIQDDNIQDAVDITNPVDIQDTSYKLQDSVDITNPVDIQEEEEPRVLLPGTEKKNNNIQDAVDISNPEDIKEASKGLSFITNSEDIEDTDSFINNSSEQNDEGQKDLFGEEESKEVKIKCALKPRCDYSFYAEKYNEICKDLPRCTKITETRKSHLRTIESLYGREQILQAFSLAQASDFLTGRRSAWRANFDWVINKNNLVKILEGNYTNRSYKARRDETDMEDFDYDAYIE